MNILMYTKSYIREFPIILQNCLLSSLTFSFIKMISNCAKKLIELILESRKMCPTNENVK